MAFDQQTNTSQASRQISEPLKNCSASKCLLNKAREAIVLAIHENFMRKA